MINGYGAAYYYYIIYYIYITFIYIKRTKRVLTDITRYEITNLLISVAIGRETISVYSETEKPIIIDVFISAEKLGAI